MKTKFSNIEIKPCITCNTDRNLKIKIEEFANTVTSVSITCSKCEVQLISTKMFNPVDLVIDEWNSLKNKEDNTEKIIWK